MCSGYLLYLIDSATGLPGTSASPQLAGSVRQADVARKQVYVPCRMLREGALSCGARPRKWPPRKAIKKSLCAMSLLENQVVGGRRLYWLGPSAWEAVLCAVAYLDSRERPIRVFGLLPHLAYIHVMRRGLPTGLVGWVRLDTVMFSLFPRRPSLWSMTIKKVHIGRSPTYCFEMLECDFQGYCRITSHRTRKPLSLLVYNFNCTLHGKP